MIYVQKCFYYHLPLKVKGRSKKIIMQTIQLRISPEYINDKNYIQFEIKKIYPDFKSYKIIKRSIDARTKKICYHLKIIVYLTQEPSEASQNFIHFKSVHTSKEVPIVGFGPAGIFAALKLIEYGYRPIIFERGKMIKERKRDIANLTKNQIVDPESNYCFGEGGAGTFSDGKLYTRANKRGNIKEILYLLIQHGADKSILIDAQPHIGTDKLPNIITAIRQTIIDYGGIINFNSKLTDIHFNNEQITGIEINHQEKYQFSNLILATGNSARDIFELLNKKSIAIESKKFALGVRVEHPQQLINHSQYHCKSLPENLPPASYKLIEQVKGLGVYSFCMCPGGIIVPSATNYNEIVTNGWSSSKRNNQFANAGIVVSINDEMLQPFSKYGHLKGVEFQKEIERKAFIVGGNLLNQQKGQICPAQRIVDFINNKTSTDLPKCSYIPGVVPQNISEVLPKEILIRLKRAFKKFDEKIKGFISEEAIITAPESRTSSPVRIPRDRLTLEHPQIKGFYPCGEGAGYAGGIISAAIDGQRCAQMLINHHLSK